MDDIGYILFVQLLGMIEYPGGPFTGNIIRDLVMFFVIPTIFIIYFIFFLLGRFLHPGLGKLRLMMGIGLYLFIVVSPYGLYRMFAYFAGPYFIFLIFIIGLLFFIQPHFGIRGRPAPATGGGEAGGHSLEVMAEDTDALHKLPRRLRGLVVMPELNPRGRAELERYREGLERRRKSLEKRYEEMLAKGVYGTGDLALQLTEVESQIRVIDKALYGGR